MIWSSDKGGTGVPESTGFAGSGMGVMDWCLLVAVGLCAPGESRTRTGRCLRPGLCRLGYGGGSCGAACGAARLASAAVAASAGRVAGRRAAWGVDTVAADE